MGRDTLTCIVQQPQVVIAVMVYRSIGCVGPRRRAGGLGQRKAFRKG